MAMCMHMCKHTQTSYSYSETTPPGNSPLIYTLKYPHRVTYVLLFYSLLQKSVFYVKWILGKGVTANETVKNVTFILYFAHKVLNWIIKME
jgi:hypothetical protein